MDHLTTPANKFSTAELLARIRISNGTTPRQQPKEMKRDPTPVSTVSNLWHNNASTRLPLRQSPSSSASMKPPPPPPTSATILTYQRETNKEIQRLQQQVVHLTKQNEALKDEKKSLEVQNVDRKRKTNDAMAKLRAQLACLSKQSPTAKSSTPSKSNLPSPTEKNNRRQHSTAIPPHQVISHSPSHSPSPSQPAVVSTVDSHAAEGTGDEDDVDDDASDDSTPPPPPPRPHTLTSKVTTTTDTIPTPDHPMYVAMDVCASAAYVAFSSLSLVNAQPTQSPSTEPFPSVDNTGATLDINNTSLGNIDHNNDGNNNDDDDVVVPLDRKDSVASMLTPPSPILSHLPSPSRLSYRNHSHHNRLPHRRGQKTATRPSITTKPILTTPTPSTMNGNNNLIVHHNASAGGHASNRSAVGIRIPSHNSSGSASSVATSSRVLGPTFSDLMRRVTPDYRPYPDQLRKDIIRIAPPTHRKSV